VSQRADGAPATAHRVGFKENTLSSRRDAAGPVNRLLEALPAQDRKRFLAACEAVDLQADQVLMRPGSRTAYVYFPTEAVVSLGLVPRAARQCLEVALVGPEGMVGLPLLLGATASTLRATVVRPGAAWRIAGAPLQLQLLESPQLARRMQRYVLVSLTQMAQAALCTRFHRLDQRLARWLLMTQDRMQHQALHATHEGLAATLGVRRAGVSRAAAELQDRQLIAYRRGVLTLLDRTGLEAAACSCYEADCAAYGVLMGLRAA
jgi:CRP-like cAMP-binding protein